MERIHDSQNLWNCVCVRFCQVLVRSVAGGKNVDDDNLKEWLNCDGSDCQFEHLREEEIIWKCWGMDEEESEKKKDVEYTTQTHITHEAALLHA